MSGKGRILRGLRVAGSGFALCSLLACMGGTGTDTENGITVSAFVVNSSGAPVANVKVEVQDLNANADSKSQSPLKDADGEIKSDVTGLVEIQLKKEGLYIAQGKRGDSVVFADTLRAVEPPKGVTLPGFGNPQFVVENPVQASGRVRLLSGFSVDSGRVTVQGTKLQSKLTGNGAYALGWLPPSLEKLKLNATYGGRASGKRFVKVVQKDSANWTLLIGASGRCLADDSSATTSANSGKGSLSSAATLARIVGTACAGRTGSQVRLLRANANGTVVGTLGDFVVPDAAAAIPDSAAVPVACIRSGVNGASQAKLRLTAGDILVNDIIRGGNCPAE